MNTEDLKCYTNSAGHRQYASDGVEVCPSCLKEYHNTGDGVICAKCDEGHQGHDDLDDHLYLHC